MNMFRRDEGSPSQTPVVPPRPTKEEMDNPIKYSLKTQEPEPRVALQENIENTNDLCPKTKQRAGVMGVVQKVNPFKSAPKTSSSSSSSDISKAPSSESLDQTTDSTQNPGMLKGVMQKVNPFKSTSQVSKAPSSDSLEAERGPDSSQNPGMFKGVMQKVNPFKSSAQLPKNEDQVSPASLDGDLREKQTPGGMTSMIQKVNPFKSSQPKDTQPLHSDLSSSSGSLTDNNNVPEKQADVNNQECL